MRQRVPCTRSESGAQVSARCAEAVPIAIVLCGPAHWPGRARSTGADTATDVRASPASQLAVFKAVNWGKCTSQRTQLVSTRRKPGEEKRVATSVVTRRALSDSTFALVPTIGRSRLDTGGERGITSSVSVLGVGEPHLARAPTLRAVKVRVGDDESPGELAGYPRTVAGRPRRGPPTMHPPDCRERRATRPSRRDGRDTPSPSGTGVTAGCTRSTRRVPRRSR